MTRGLALVFAAAAIVAAAACSKGTSTTSSTSTAPSASKTEDPSAMKLTTYVEVPLTTDLGALTAKERAMLPLLIDACRAMDDAFWMQAWGDKAALLSAIPDPALRRHAEINYGPWDRLSGDAPFVPGYGPKPAGATFYPPDMTKAEFDAAPLTDPYTVVRRDGSGKLIAVPFHEAYAVPFATAAAKLDEAAKLAEDPGLARYLTLRAKALRTDSYRESDMAWLDMKNNVVDVVIGPIENYEDKLYGIRTSAEGFVLVKDRAWSARLSRYAALLPELQRGLPVPDAYKKETPGTDSDLNAYDALYYAGDANAGAKTIAINLPNDEQVQLSKGTRRLQLKNAMRAKFDKILLPIANRLVAKDQVHHVDFDAFFANVMFHEVAHGLGIKNTLDGKSTVREALKEYYGALEEGKADVLGLYMVQKLAAMGELEGADLHNNYVTFMAGIFRSVRFGSASAHGRANAAQFRFLVERGAFSRDAASGAWRVDFAKMPDAIAALAEKILRLQGDGDLAGTASFVPASGELDPVLVQDLGHLADASIPVDVVFKQGL